MVQGLGNNLLRQNSIADFNKIFDNHLATIDKGFDQAGFGEFENILNQKSKDAQMNFGRPINAGIEVNVGGANFPNLEISEAAKVQPKSDVEKALSHFGDSFSDGIKSINEKELEAEHAVETLASGGDISMHEVMIAAEKANLSMQMGLQLRNKILAAYTELYNVKI